MHTLGHGFIPPGIHAGGLRYHGCSPLVSALVDKGLVEARAVPQTRVFDAAVLFARSEGIVPAPETAHAIAAVADIARSEPGEKCIVFNLSGHGLLDLAVLREVPQRGSWSITSTRPRDRGITAADCPSVDIP